MSALRPLLVIAAHRVAYVEAMQRQNVLDCDDLLLRPGPCRRVGERVDHVLVDECQDTNRLQAFILLALKPGGRGLPVIGDDAQDLFVSRRDGAQHPRLSRTV
jgi:DNA helicase-2/ATP-dependent DNA helicase PcrA